MSGRSPRWRRNQRLKCECGGYHFPHRIKGGACIHSATAIFHSCIRQGMSEAEAKLEQALEGPRVTTGVCPF